MTRPLTPWLGAARAIALVVAVPQGQATLHSQLIGHWRLVSTATAREGEAPTSTLGPAPLGTIVYRTDGHVQAHLTRSGRVSVRPADASPAEARALARYTAYFGRFAVDEAGRTVTHRRDGTFVPGERDIVRTIDLSGNRLVLTTPTTRTIVVHTTADLNPLNTGVDQIRFYEFDGDLMYLQPPPASASGGPQPQSRITWRRVK